MLKFPAKKENRLEGKSQACFIGSMRMKFYQCFYVFDFKDIFFITKQYTVDHSQANILK